MDVTGVNGLGPTPANASAQVPAHQAAENRNLNEAVRALNAAQSFGDQNEMTFLFDHNTRLPVIRIVDRKTREVVEQIPPEYVLRLAEELRKA